MAPLTQLTTRVHCLLSFNFTGGNTHFEIRNFEKRH